MKMKPLTTPILVCSRCYKKYRPHEDYIRQQRNFCWRGCEAEYKREEREREKQADNGGNPT